MKTMWSRDELIKLIEEHGGNPEQFIKTITRLQDGSGITWKNQSDAIQQFRITAEILHELIQGSESVVVDLSEDNKHLEVHLDADILAKIDRALLLPLSVSEFKLIGVDNEASKKNAPTQQLIGIDSDTLEVVNGKLTTKKLYKHLISFSIESGGTIFNRIGVLTLEIISRKNHYSYSEFIQLLTTTSKHFSCNGKAHSIQLQGEITIYKLNKSSTADIKIYTFRANGYVLEDYDVYIDSASYLDEVSEII